MIVGATGRRSVPLSEFFLGPGKTALAPVSCSPKYALPTPRTGTGSAYARHTPAQADGHRRRRRRARSSRSPATASNGARRARRRCADAGPRAPGGRQRSKARSPSDEVFARAAEAAPTSAVPSLTCAARRSSAVHIVRVDDGANAARGRAQGRAIARWQIPS